MAFNDLWCLAHPEIHTLSIGAARPSDFDEHVAALRRLPRGGGAGAAHRPRLEARYAEAVGDDFARRWREGLPEWWDMPGRINVRRILWLHNLVRAFDLRDFAQERYAAMSPDDHWVPGARADPLPRRGDRRRPARLPLPRHHPRPPARGPRRPPQPRGGGGPLTAAAPAAAGIRAAARSRCFTERSQEGSLVLAPGGDPSDSARRGGGPPGAGPEEVEEGGQGGHQAAADHVVPEEADVGEQVAGDHRGLGEQRRQEDRRAAGCGG